MSHLTPIDSPDVAAAFDDFSDPIRHRLLELRELVLETAQETDGVTGFEEGLRWGEPSFITKSGSTVRMAQASANEFGLYFNCLSRGRSLYHRDGIDSDLLARTLPGVPILGFFCNAEIGPLRGVNQLFTYTGMLMLIAD